MTNRTLLRRIRRSAPYVIPYVAPYVVYVGAIVVTLVASARAEKDERNK